ncbi:MAG: lamin tail domain-containing protein [Flavobacteriales bacterium]
MVKRYAFLLFGATFFLPAFSQLVINEVDYDQPGNDGAEFIELKNTGTLPFDMSTIAVRMVNGSSAVGVVYKSYFSDDWPMLAPGAYFTLCGDTTAGCDARLNPASNAIQNGATDAIALILRSDSSFVDRLAYEGFLADYSEGNGFAGGDDNVNPDRSIGRYPDGVDTDNNNADFIVMCSSLGASNNGDTLGCTTTSIAALTAAVDFSLVADGASDRVLMSYAPANGNVTFDVFSVDGALMASHTVAANGKANWAWNTGGMNGRMLIVRVSGAMGTKAKRVVLP